MKKFITFIVMILGLVAPGLRAETLLNPVPGKQYMIMHSSGNFMTVSDNTVKIMSPGTGESQIFTFEVAVPGDPAAYNIRLYNGEFLGSDAGYTIKFLTDPEDSYAQFQIEESDLEGFVKFYNVGRKAYLGTDNNNDGGGIYTDKSGADGKHAWKIIEAIEGGVITVTLEEAITSAKNYIESEGESLSAEAQAIINEKIAEAEAVLSAPADQESVNEAAETLNSFMSAVKTLQTSINYARNLLNTITIGTGLGDYPADAVETLEMTLELVDSLWADGDTQLYVDASEQIYSDCNELEYNRIVFIPEAGKRYYFFNTFSELAMGINETPAAALAEPDGAISQLFEIIPSDERSTVFYLKLADGRGYLATTGGWNSTVVPEITDEARFQFDLVDLSEGIYTLNRYNLKGAWASDSNDPGSLIYTDKSRTKENAQWKILGEGESSVATISKDNTVIKAFDGQVYVSGVNAEATVSVYTFDGQRVFMTGATGDVNVALPAGGYIVVVSSTEGTTTSKLFVK